MHRKGWKTCRSPKSYNLSPDCPPCLELRLVLFKMADEISTPKVTNQRYISSQRYKIPNNITMKKRQKPSAFYYFITLFNYFIKSIASSLYLLNPLPVLIALKIFRDIQLFRQRLSHKSVTAYATMPNGFMGTKSFALID